MLYQVAHCHECMAANNWLIEIFLPFSLYVLLILPPNLKLQNLIRMILRIHLIYNAGDDTIFIN
jgi:hypothetical protein